MQADFLYKNGRLATMQESLPGYGLIDNGAFAIANGRIAWIGDSNDIPQQYQDLPSEDLQGKLVTPALIDCHTHLIFGGNRAGEFEMRLNGASYEQIAKAGGGINSTVTATRDSSDQQLLNNALRRLDQLMAEGVAVVEIKSGYGLTIEDEVRMLRIARQLQQLRPIKIVTTWLAAHSIPTEFKGKADDYIDQVVLPGLKQAADEGLVDAVDGFCENIAFSRPQMERVFNEAKSLNLPVKLHAEQLSDQKGALLVAEHDGLSADHLEYLDPDDVASFAKSNAVAVLLPGAFYCLRETKLPPIEEFRKHQISMAVASDCNPGSSPIVSLLTTMNMACIQFSMTPEEALAGTTRHAAKALGLEHEYGQIKVGATAELAVWDVNHPAELSYWVGLSMLNKRISHRGK